MLSDSPQVVDNRALDQERPDQPRHRGAGDGDEDDDGLFSGGLSKLGLPLISFGEDASPNYKNVPLPGPSSKVQVQGRVQAWQETISQANAEGNKARPWFPENSNVDEKELLNAKVVTKRTVSGFSASAVDLSQTVTPDHAQGWDETRTKVNKALKSVLGTTLDVTHEALATGADLLQLAPVPGLAEAARVLLNLWDALQMVDGNRLACLRLVSRCADILVSVREEVLASGDKITEDLVGPVQKLIESFTAVQTFLLKQARRPFLKRYLKRDEILSEIEECDKALADALNVFGIQIQIRILRNLQESEKHWREDNRELMEEMLRTRRAIEGVQLPPSKSIFSPPMLDASVLPNTPHIPIPGSSKSKDDVTPKPSILDLPPQTPPATPEHPQVPRPIASPIRQSTPPPPYLQSPLALSHSESQTPMIPYPSDPQSISAHPLSPHTQLQTLQTLQNTLDTSLDAADLRTILKTTLALGATSDAGLVEVLGVGREEMPGAIKALQRALERVIDKQSAVDEGGSSEGLGLSFVEGVSGLGLGRNASVSSGDGYSISPNTSTNVTPFSRKVSLKRANTGESNWSVGYRGSQAESERDKERDVEEDRTLDREFMESGIDALRRMSDSRGVDVGLPSWSITTFELSHTKKIGIGFYSNVYLGTYSNDPRPVAIKVLSPMTPREIFTKEVIIWKSLRHPNVLELIGASAVASSSPTSSTMTTGASDGGAENPWFLVSPFMANGNVVTFLRMVNGRGKSSGAVMGLGMVPSSFPSSAPANGSALKGKEVAAEVARKRTPLRPIVEGETNLEMEVDLLKMMYELAKGMEYLHSKGVLHGDLKGTNVLVDDRLRCVITDFGQSEMRSETSRISGRTPPHGTFRWQAPELMLGLGATLTTEMDVYAFAICCVEILGMGRMPWPHIDDETVRFAVSQGSRPEIPKSKYATPALVSLITRCWHRDPFRRPSFSDIVKELKVIRKSFKISANAVNFDNGLSPPSRVASMENEQRHRRSPDIKPQPLPLPRPRPKDHAHAFGISPDSSHWSTSASSYLTAKEGDISTSFSHSPPRPLDGRGYLGVASGPQDHPRLGHKRSKSAAATASPLLGASRPTNPRRLSLGFGKKRPTAEDTVGSPTRDVQKVHGKVVFLPSSVRSRSSSGDSSVFAHSSSEGTESVSEVGDDETDEAMLLVEDEYLRVEDGGVRYEYGYEGGAIGLSGSVIAAEQGQERFDGPDSPPPANDRIAQVKNERRYRLMLTHEFHPSLTLPLWCPTAIQLGAVGYLSKPQGAFVTLFNSFNPIKTSGVQGKEFPSLHGYGQVTTGSQRQDRRSAAQRGMDAIAGLWPGSSKASQSFGRRHTFTLRAGHKAAILCTEMTMYRYVESLDAPKKWFKANVDQILQIYGAQHRIQKEDLFLVIGTLNSPDYGLFVSHSHPDAQVHCNIFSGAAKSQPWGAFSIDAGLPADVAGPSYHEFDAETTKSASVMSQVGGDWNTLLIARLRFKPDGHEPTSL